MVAWLITWEWSGEHARIDKKVAEVLKWRLSPKIVREIVEALYAYREYTPTECMRYCAKNNGKNNPYPARFGDVNGVPWQARIYCGHNPYLYASIVDDLHIHTYENGERELTWTERLVPEHLQKMMKDSSRLPK